MIFIAPKIPIVMPKLPGTKETMVRGGTLIAIILGILVQVIFYGIKTPDNALMIIIPIIGVFGFVFLQKFDLVIKKEIEFLDDHPILAWSIWVGACVVLQTVLGYLIADVPINIWLYYIPLLISMFILTYAWHYCLSIYKDEKMRYYIALLLGVVIWVLFGFIGATAAFAIIPPAIISLAAAVNYLMEQRLMKKKLLKFI